MAGVELVVLVEQVVRVDAALSPYNAGYRARPVCWDPEAGGLPPPKGSVPAPDGNLG